MKIKRPTYASVTATVALFVALGGSSYAAITITGANVRNGTLTGSDVKNGTVKGKDVADSSITGRHVKNGSVSSEDIKDASLQAGDFGPGALPAGATGPAGPAGPQGDRGEPGAPGATNLVTRSREVEVPFGTVQSGEASCEENEVAVGGSASVSGGFNPTLARLLYDEPREANGTLPEDGDAVTSWAASATVNYIVGESRTLSILVFCAST